MKLAEALESLPAGARVASLTTGNQWCKRPDGMWACTPRWQPDEHAPFATTELLLAIHPPVRQVGVIHRDEVACLVCKRYVEDHTLGDAPEPGARRPWLCPPFEDTCGAMLAAGQTNEATHDHDT